MRTNMPVGVEDFKEARENYYLVDKTFFIKDLLDDHAKVTLITRPRRFGKTLTLSMLDYFFSAQRKEETKHLFDTLSIGRMGGSYIAERGSRPVIFMTLKNIQALTWDSMARTLSLFLGNQFINYRPLAESSRIDPETKRQFERILTKKAGVEEMAGALSILMALLREYYGRPVLLLLDEYDAPLQCAWEHGFYKECISFMRTFLGSALKTNPDLDFAILTGVLRIAKESIFSGLNNLRVCTVLDDAYNNVMGFTPAEVERMAQDLSMESHLPELKAWYDGYHFGKQDIYNPWSVINYFAEKRLDDYWVNTSGNSILASLLHPAGADKAEALLDLLHGKSITASIREGVIYNDIGADEDAFYTMLLTTGYLTAVHKEKDFGGYLCDLVIPNREVQDVFRSEVVERTRHSMAFSRVLLMMKDLVAGRAESFTTALERYLAAQVSFYDTAQKESFYHGLLLGLTGLLVPAYQVESNGESGDGRFDLAIFPKDTAKAGVVLELKAAASEEELPAKAEEALRQIQEKRYTAAFEKRGIRTVWLYGIAFYKKKVKVAYRNVRMNG